jgi:hypothetical protein
LIPANKQNLPGQLEITDKAINCFADFMRKTVITGGAILVFFAVYLARRLEFFVSWSIKNKLRIILDAHDPRFVSTTGQVTPSRAA